MCECKEELKQLKETIKKLSEKIDELEDHAKTICCGTNCSKKVYTDMMHKCYFCPELFCDFCIIEYYCLECKIQINQCMTESCVKNNEDTRNYCSIKCYKINPKNNH